MMQLCVGATIVHSLHGVGHVETLEDKDILGKMTRFAVISFQEDRLKIMVNIDQRNSMLRALMTSEEVEVVMEHLKNHTCATVISKSTQRYNVNMQKIKSGDVNSLAEVVKELSGLLEEKRLTQKELTMLEQSRKILAAELSQVTQRSEEESLAWIEQSCARRELVSAQ
jgi:CarD family transcriptional regulator